MRTSLSVLLLSVAAALAACGGASNDSHAPPSAPPPATPSGVLPPSATASIQAFVAFLGGLMASDTAAPLDIDAAVPPTSETAAPLAVD